MVFAQVKSCFSIWLMVAMWALGTFGVRGEGMTPWQVAQLKSVVSVALSPDGAQVAYLLSVPRIPGVDDDGPAWTELWLRNPGETNARPFMTGKVQVQSLAWAPDGKHLEFLVKRGDDKTKSLYRMPNDGGEARKLVEMETDIEAFEWSGDGRRVALLAKEPEGSDLKKLREKGFKQEIYEEDWRMTRVWIVEPGLDPMPKPAFLPVNGSVRALAWSPASDRLALAVTPTPSVDDGMMNQRLQIVDATTGTVQAEVQRAGKQGEFSWSPDGSQLAMIAAVDMNDPSAGRLMRVAATGGAPRDLIPGFIGEVNQFVWLNSDEIVFVAAVGARSILGRISSSGTPSGTPGSAPYTVRQPVNQAIVTGLDISRDGTQLAILAHTSRYPTEVFTSGTANGDWVRSTHSNPWLDDVDFAHQEVIRHTARDGLVLEGILVRPLGYQEGRRYPLILAVHGGPESHVSDGWVTSYSLPGQVGAARGFAVFYPNYRGSTGRGVDFSKLGQADAAGKEFDDLVDAVDHLIEIGLVDRDRVGVTGGSYGGYATAWCSTRYSERFAAGVMFVGISDKISKVGTTDIADEEFYVHALKRPWDDWLFLLERSPIYHAGNSRTPLMILHGADDPRVNVGQSREIYRHLKLRSQAPVRLVLYPGEGHGNRKAAARYDYQLRMLQWFEHYLQNAGKTPPDYTLDYALPSSSEK
jgi:dipeptidyl aminopeptidase/acylaminoacyl peptidase